MHEVRIDESLLIELDRYANSATIHRINNLRHAYTGSFDLVLIAMQKADSDAIAYALEVMRQAHFEIQEYVKGQASHRAVSNGIHHSSSSVFVHRSAGWAPETERRT